MDVVAIEDGNGAILPTWTAVDNNNVRTSRELWEHMRSEGWHVEVSVTIRTVLTQVLKMKYISIIGECVAGFGAEVLTRFSIPISPDRPIEVCIPSFSLFMSLSSKTQDDYVDAYLRVIKNADPLQTSLVFSCGMGAVRTTFAMTAACVVRRRQLMLRGLPDPYAARLPRSPHLSNAASGVNTVSQVQILLDNLLTSGVRISSSLVDIRYVTHRAVQLVLNGINSVPQTPPHGVLNEAKVRQVLDQANAQQDLNRSLLRLTNILQQLLPSGQSHSVIDLLLSNSSLLDDLRKAHMGNYGMILSLLGLLDNGLKTKKLVDKVIDSCKCGLLHLGCARELMFRTGDHVVNLREDILVHRIKYSLSSLEEPHGNSLLKKAGKALEK